jgi:hypothetical protein
LSDLSSLWYHATQVAIVIDIRHLLVVKAAIVVIPVSSFSIYFNIHAKNKAYRLTTNSSGAVAFLLHFQDFQSRVLDQIAHPQD